MKKIIIILTILVILTSVAVYLYKNKEFVQEATITETPKISPKPTNINIATPTSADNKTSNNFNVEYIIVRDPKKIILYDNSTEKLSSTDALKQYGCDKIVSGGFWRESDGEAIGLLISEGNILQKSVASLTFNGFFYIDKSQKSNITNIEPNNSEVRVAIQSGPILFEEGLPITLKLESDENARRIVLAKSQKGEIVFLIFYYKPSTLIGPKLADLPLLLDELYKSSNLKLNSAINLDGGAHSAFINGDINLIEVSRAGSFFCIKP